MELIQILSSIILLAIVSNLVISAGILHRIGQWKKEEAIKQKLQRKDAEPDESKKKPDEKVFVKEVITPKPKKVNLEERFVPVHPDLGESTLEPSQFYSSIRERRTEDQIKGDNKSELNESKFQKLTSEGYIQPEKEVSDKIMWR